MTAVVVEPVGGSADIPQSADPARPRSRRSVIGYMAVVLLLAGTIVGVRFAFHHGANTPTPVTVAHPAEPFPSSPKVEAVWGLRFTAVIVLADNGGVELRYQVIDEAKAEKIHLGDANSNQLPTIRIDRTRKEITPSSVLMHFHHGDTVSGQSYSIVYGNAGGAVRSGGFVTIVMKDGLTINHVQVSD